MPTPAQHREDLIARMHDVLRSTFGFDGFKGKQEEAILATLKGRDCLVLMPTGGGKSLCYALPALLQPGLALVVSPLIALMQNQVEGFRAAGVAAAALSSATPAGERETLLADVCGVPEPSTKLLFVTPELLNTEGFQARLRGLGSRKRVSLLAVDEAHCISSWGHDFRPSYRRLAFARRCLPGVPVLALTATAAQKVQDDIVQQLGFGGSSVRLAASFDRPNIRYCVRYADTLPHEDRIADIAAFYEAARSRVPSRAPASAIVYTLKRDTADEVAAALTRKGVRCGAYHAGLRPAERERVLGDWTGGRLPAVAATVAFGMGIDRGGVALVAHYNLPKTLEGFYQESGRAGRDGLPAQSVLYYGVEDRRRMDALLAKGDRRHARKRPQPDSGVAAEQDAVAAARSFGEVVAYAMKATCRRRAVLAHFGEALPPGGCSGCDVCDEAPAVELQIARVEAKGLAAQNTRFGQRLDFSGGSSRKRRRGSGGSEHAGDGLTDYDAEGWAAGLSDKDDVGPNHGFGGAQSSGDEDSNEERQAAVAAAVAQQAKARGGSAMAALQRAEEAGAAKPTGTAARLLQRLEGGAAAHPAAAAPAAPAVDDAARQRSRAHLQKVLAGNAKLRLAPHQAAAAAQALEADAFGGGGSSSSVYRSRVAASARAIAAAASVPALPPAAVQATSIAAATAEPACDAANGTAAAPQPVQPGQSTDPASDERNPDATSATAAANDSAGLLAQFEVLQGMLAADDVDAALAALQQLGRSHVTAALLAETGLGRMLKPLTKHSSPAIAAAAADAIAAWKSAVLAQRRQ